MRKLIKMNNIDNKKTNNIDFDLIIENFINFVSKYIYFFIFFIQTFYILSTELIIYYFKNDFYYLIEHLALRLSNINILYVKIFQALALNNNFIDNEMNNKLMKFTDHAPWNESDIDYLTLFEIQENSGNMSNLIINDIPINSGMISLVFKAYKYNDNNEKLEYVIKIKRVNIDYNLNISIENLMILIKCIEFFSFLPFINMIKKYDLYNIIDKNIKLLKDQLCFEKEVENMKIMKNNCKNLKYIIIPNVYEDITNRFNNVIIMDFIKGNTIEYIEKEDYDEFAKQVVKFGFITSILHGFCHGDLHAGNILFIKDNNDPKYKYKLCILDFGIIYSIDHEFKTFLFETMSDMFTTDSLILAEKLINSGLIEPRNKIEELKLLQSEHYDNILQMLKNILENSLDKNNKANQLHIYKALDEFNKYLNNNNLFSLGLRPSTNFVKIQLTLAMSHGVTMKLCKDYYMELADKVLNELFHLDYLFDN